MNLLSPIAALAKGARRLLREHRHLVIVVALLTLVMTFPTIIYVFRTDTIWHPAGGSYDVHIKFWDVWYGGQFLSGQADPLYTDLIFYPEGVALNRHPFFIPHIIAVNALRAFLPIWNAFSLAHLLSIATTAVCAYVYLRWLFQDKWIALFGAVVFGFSPQAMAHANHPDIGFIAPMPLILYGFHRGVVERRVALIAVAGLLAGLTTVINFYLFVCVLFTLAFYVCALAIARWRDRRFWLYVALLALVIALSSLWRLQPLFTDAESIDEIARWHRVEEVRTEALSFFVNHLNPFMGRFLTTLLPPQNPNLISKSSFLGYLPLALICLCLFSRAYRRKTLPWLLLCLPFLILRLGSYLTVNGIVYHDIRLPKYYLDELLPVIFESFWEVDNFMAGALLPFAVLSCFGFIALQKRLPAASKPWFILALIAIVALEYYTPIEADRVFPRGDGFIHKERFAFLDWLAEEDLDDIRLIYLPFGRQNSKLYNIYQIHSGYPTAGGAISRTPESAFDYMRRNHILKAWQSQRPVHCDVIEQEAYLEALRGLEADGFSHVVYHPRYEHWQRIHVSFRNIKPSYADAFVSVFSLEDLRASCPRAPGIRHQFTSAYAKSLQTLSHAEARPGVAVVFPPTAEANEHFLHYLREFSPIERRVVTVARGEQGAIRAQSSIWYEAEITYPLESQAALWLVDDVKAFPAAQSDAFQGWFLQRFQFCARYRQDESARIDLYVRADVPCSALDESSVKEVRYSAGLRLRNASHERTAETVRFFLSWSKETEVEYGFSLQFFDGAGQKALQYDNVILRHLLEAHEIDIAPLAEGAYQVKLIVYDAETGARLGGRLIESGEGFEGQLEIARIDV